MKTNTISATTDKRGIEQISAGAMGLLVCGLVTAVIWFFAVRSFGGAEEYVAGALDCETAVTYGVTQDGCARP